jgi:hypothetical protein
MRKPKIGEEVRLVGEQITFIHAKVFEIYDDIDVWWDTAVGENKVALMDALEEYGAEKAATAEWYAMVENVEYPGETMAVASFEVEFIT